MNGQNLVVMPSGLSIELARDITLSVGAGGSFEHESLA
jgi:hypothetical protein